MVAPLSHSDIVSRFLSIHVCIRGKWATKSCDLFLTLIGRVKMTIFIRSSLKKRHCINVTRISDVNERHRDALRRGMDD